MTRNDVLFINGIDAITGEYLLPPLRFNEAVALLKGAPDPPSARSLLRHVWQALNEPDFGLPFDVDPADPRAAGWGVVFHHEERPEVREALAPLIEHRRNRAVDVSRVKVLEYRTGEDRGKWLARYGVGAGTVVPNKVPYYLLLVGSPGKIPFSFCHLLDVEYSVGWLDFDSPEEYACYAQSVIRYESEPKVSNSREVVYFATRHDFDRATQLSADQLVSPLADDTPTASGIAKRQGFRTRKLLGDTATKGALIEILEPKAGNPPPSLVFTATHGVAFPRGHVQQVAAQGALLCQNWPGLGTIGPEQYFAASDLPKFAQVHGLITFHFACYGGGTPTYDRFLHKPGSPPPMIADHPFVAALPKALLSHPRGGALAVIAHVERAWGYSFINPNATSQILPFENAIGRILVGQPVGFAMKDVNERYAALATALSSKLEEIGFGAQISDFELVTNWTERNDAEGYVVLGDPAVSLRASELE